MSAKLIQFLIIIFFSFNTTCFATGKPILPIKQWLTQSGTPVYFVQEKELPMIDIQVVFDAGSARDMSKPGIAKITNDALSAGTPSKNAYQVAAAFENVGANFSSAVSRDMAVVAMRSLSDQHFFQPAFNMFTQVLASASFPDSEFKRIQKQSLSSIEEQEQQPAAIATKAFYRVIYDQSPYGHPVSGDKQNISKLTANDLRSFFKTFYTAQNSMIFIVGDTTEAQAKQMAETLSSRLNKGQKPNPLSFASLSQKQIEKHITFPSSQTHILIGQNAISRNDPAYFPLIVGNYVLGGGMLTSRLFDEVREKRGLVYTVRSQFNTLKDKGPFIIELQTRTKEAKNAINVTQNTLKKFMAEGPTARELEAAKKNLAQGFILKLASNSAIISQLIAIGYYHLPFNYLDTYKDNISKVTNNDVKSAFQKTIHPDRLATVTVGEATR
jgi:zinc protease